jgi:hypothetical protein
MPASAMGFLALIFLLGLGIVLYAMSDGSRVTAESDATPPVTTGQSPTVKPAPAPAPRQNAPAPTTR